MVLDHGLGLTALPWIAALAPMAALGVAWLSVRMEQGNHTGVPVAQACP
ncbi:hypothetical protein [Cupriavidus necator]